MKFHIENRAEISDVLLFELVLKVINQGLISNNDTEYCYATLIGLSSGNEYIVQTIKTNYGYRIIVGKHKEKTHEQTDNR